MISSVREFGPISFEGFQNGSFLIGANSNAKQLSHLLGAMKKRNARRFGYARVSTDDQKLSLQLDALKGAKCDRIFADKGVSGAKRTRKELDALLGNVLPGDEIVTWKLDRLGRRVRHLLELLDGFTDRGICYRSLTETIDMSTPEGEFLATILAAVAQYERHRDAERTRAGMAAAKARGVILGRPRSLSVKEVARARRQMASKGRTIADLADQYGVAPITMRRALKQPGKRAA